jgi:hypothetical protein
MGLSTDVRHGGAVPWEWEVGLGELQGKGPTADDLTRHHFDDPDCWKSTRAKHGDDRFLSFMVTSDSWIRWVIEIEKQFSTRVFIATNLAHHTLLSNIERRMVS